ncbi:MAG: ferritin family protein [Bacteroidota bacterium]|nr:ferritin family protein [Bacteroidota bacterium]MDP4204375.1 ferritin family protein [Bacteroidota bacterium]
MKRVRLFLMILIAASIVMACNQKAKKDQKPIVSKTVENLKTALKDELTTVEKYRAYSERARADGYGQISALFNAIARSEGIHANNHIGVLTSLGITADSTKGSFVVKSTKENLEESINGEAKEVFVLYPAYIKSANDENAPDAIRTFTWAMGIEKKHGYFYQSALEALKTNDLTELPYEYLICPKCGNTFEEIELEPKCPFCKTDKGKFIVVK